MHRAQRHASILLLTCAACTVDGGVPPVESTFTSHDSAGIEIVDNKIPMWTDVTAWVVGKAPAVTIGVDEGDAPYLLDAVTAATRLTDGRIVIADGGSTQLRFFDPTGAFLYAAGRKGRGPGEFARPEHLVRLPGDSVVAWDPGLRRYGVFGPTGKFVRQQRIDVDHVMATITMRRATEAMTPLSDGSFIIHATERGDPHQMGVPSGQLHRDQIGFYRFRPDGAVDSLGWFAGGLPQLYLVLGGRPVYATMRISWHARLAVSPDANRVFITEGDPHEIAEIVLDEGTRARIIRRITEPVPIPDSILARLRDRWSSSPIAQQQHRVQEALPPQTHWPAIRDMRVDPDGYLWVSTFAEGTDVFDVKGSWLAAC